MKVTLLSVMLTTSLVAGTSSALSAQSKTIPGETTTITATVEAIDATTRTLTVKGAGGTSCRSLVPKSVERFSEIKVGDTITARYYDNIVLRVKPAGEAAVDTTSESVTKGSGASPAAHGRDAANDHRDDRRHRQQRAVDHVQGREGELDVLVARRRQGGPGESQGRRSRGHHVDGGVDGVRDVAEEVD